MHASIYFYISNYLIVLNIILKSVSLYSINIETCIYIYIHNYFQNYINTTKNTYHSLLLYFNLKYS